MEFEVVWGGTDNLSMCLQDARPGSHNFYLAISLGCHLMSLVIGSPTDRIASNFPLGLLSEGVAGTKISSCSPSQGLLFPSGLPSSCRRGSCWLMEKLSNWWLAWLSDQSPRKHWALAMGILREGKWGTSRTWPEIRWGWRSTNGLPGHEREESQTQHTFTIHADTFLQSCQAPQACLR